MGAFGILEGNCSDFSSMKLHNNNYVIHVVNSSDL